MQCKMMKQLRSWKEEYGRKPLILKGVAQVGKTYLLKEFGNQYLSDTLYQFRKTTKSIQTF